MSNAFEEINHILADWNPIGVNADIVLEEYRGYVPSIIQHIGDKKELLNYLTDILVSTMDVGFDATNKEHVDDLLIVCDRLMSVRL